MSPRIILGLALILLTGLALPSSIRAVSVDIHVLPANLSNSPISVKVADAKFGKRFIVFYRTNEQTLDQFLHASLLVANEENQIAECPAEKTR